MSYTPPPPPDGGSEGGYGDGQQPPGQYPAGPGYGAPPPTGNNSKAVAALVLGIIGFVFAICCSLLGLVMGVIAIIIGRVARKEIASTGGLQGGDPMARAGFVLGIVDVVIALILIIIGIVLNANGFDPFQLNTSP